MHTDQFSVKAIFDEAVEMEDSDARRAFLDRACVDNPEIRRKLDALLQAYVDAGSFLQKPAIQTEVTDDFPVFERMRDPLAARPVTEGPGTRIGPYKLLQQIGEGGMGVVYMAEQEKPVRRRVALKIIKPGMDTKQVIARFEAERQALALMDHPNIARVMDAGATESGRPYFIMELVHGVPITKYCDDAQLTPRERLELFIPVCQAIQHAHQKGIIHRDIKPSNVLVTLYDGKPVAKVIDFGVAKATDQRLTERTMFTQYGSIVGTLEYMSPEQAEMSALGVDTRSDIYSMGVLLYELLTGSTPLERMTLREVGYAEILKRIKEEEPPRPSTRLSESGDRLPSISSQRKTEPSKLAGLVRGELDWIVMKSLDKDRSRRYETANAFARDVERYLKDETVEACPPSASYRFRKFCRKSRAAILTISALATLLGLGSAMCLAMAIQAARAERRLAVEAAMAEMARREALVERQKAEASSQFLRRSLYDSDVQLAGLAWNSGNIVRMRELLDGHRPRSGEDDLRGFEWHYLWNLGAPRAASPQPPLIVRGPDQTSFVHPTTASGASRFAAAFEAPRGQTEVKVWDEAGKVVFTATDRAPEGLDPSFRTAHLKLSRDGNRLAYSSSNRVQAAGKSLDVGRLIVWDVDASRELFRRDQERGTFVDTTLSPDGRSLASNQAMGSGPQSERKSWVSVWDLDTARELLRLDVPDIARLAFTPKGRRLAGGLSAEAGGSGPGELRVWEVATGKVLLSRKWAGGSIGRPAYSDDGRFVAVAVARADEPGTIKVLESDGGKERHSLTSQRVMIPQLVFSPNGKRLASYAAAPAQPAEINLWELGGGRELLTIPTKPVGDSQYTGLAFSPDGNRLFSIAGGARGDAEVRVWDATPRIEERPPTSRPLP